jgi:hypothetical protein
MDYRGIAKKIRTDLGCAKAKNDIEDRKTREGWDEFERIKSLPVSELEALLADAISAPASHYSKIYNGVDYGESLRRALILSLKYHIYQARERENQPQTRIRQ